MAESSLENSTMEKVEMNFKVVMLGNMAVGKSSIMYRFTDEKFDMK